MTATPKWYCRNKSQPTNSFSEINALGIELRRITKRIIIDVKMDVFNEHDSLIEECEKIIEKYWSFKDESRNTEIQALTKKIKRSPYNSLLIKKFNILMELNDRRFCQLTFVLKKALTDLLRKSTQAEVWLHLALQLIKLYNKCRRSNKPSNIDPTAESSKDSKDGESEFNANICSNMFPALLLPFKPIDFAYVLQYVSQTRIEQNALDLMFGLFNMGDDEDIWRGNGESNCSSLEILRILTINLAGDGEFQQYYESTGTGAMTTPVSQLTRADEESRVVKKLAASGQTVDTHLNKSMRRKHTEQFLQREKAFIADLIAKSNTVCPSIFGSKSSNTQIFADRGMRLMWSYVGIILDHIILWWIDTPISCYSMAHVDSIRCWLNSQTIDDIPEPVFSTLRGIGEILTNFVCNSTWDQLFRLTLISSACTPSSFENAVEVLKASNLNVSALEVILEVLLEIKYKPMLQKIPPGRPYGTPTGTVWIHVFSNLAKLSNSCFTQSEVENLSLLPVAEQIPILHRIDHSIHSMRLWVKEQAKVLCSEWRMDRFFQILEHDVKISLDVLTTLKLPKLTADLSDILMLVNVALRTKLVFEVGVNLDMLKKTTDECVQILSVVCRVLSLANFSLCFPGPLHWQQTVFDNDEKSAYVGYVLEQIFLPTVKATKDIVILKLVLKIICEAWLDYIYKKRVRFSVNGAVRLLNDFDDVREWILSCTLLDDEQLNKLSNHEVLRMCKGVGKILLRKPEDIISIEQSPKYSKKEGSTTEEETQLPSEMFVSNQKHWLQLRANNNNFSFWKLCCGDSVL